MFIPNNHIEQIDMAWHMSDIYSNLSVPVISTKE